MTEHRVAPSRMELAKKVTFGLHLAILYFWTKTGDKGGSLLLVCG